MGSVTLSDAFVALLPWIGTGGLTAIIVALIGYYRDRNKPKPNGVPNPALAIAALYADRSVMENAADAVEKLRNAVDQHRDSIDRHTVALRESTLTYVGSGPPRRRRKEDT